MVRLNSGLPEFSNIICPSRQQPTWMDQTRNLEIPGSCFARPGMTRFNLLLTEDADMAHRQVGSAPRIARRAALCSIARSGARFAGTPVPAGFKPEFP